MKRKAEKGNTLIVALFLALAIWLLFIGALNTIASQYKKNTQYRLNTSAFHVAEAGITKGIWELNKNFKYSGDVETKLENGSFEIKIIQREGICILSSTGYVPNTENIKAKQTIEAIIEKDAKGVYKVKDWQNIQIK